MWVRPRRVGACRSSRSQAVEAGSLLICRAFEELGAHRLWLDVKVDNHRVRRLYSSMGFREEGLLRDCLKVGARFESLVVMSMLAEQYLERRS